MSVAMIASFPFVSAGETKVVKMEDCINASGNIEYKAEADGETVQFDEGGAIKFGTEPFTGNVMYVNAVNTKSLMTVANPLQVRNDDRVNIASGTVTLAGGVSLQEGENNALFYKLNAGAVRFTAEGSLSIAKGLLIPYGGTVLFDGGVHQGGELRQPANWVVFTNGANVVFSAMNLGRTSAANLASLYSYSSSVTSEGAFNLGANQGASGIYYMKDGTLTVAGNTLIGNNKGTGILNINGGTVNFDGTLNVGYWQGGSIGTLRIFAGDVSVPGGAAVFGSEGGGTVGNIYMEGGQLSFGKNAVLGREGNCRATVVGGTITLNADDFALGYYAKGTTRTGTGDGRLDMSGGKFRYLSENNTKTKSIGWSGTGVVSVASSAVFSIPTKITLANNTTGYGEIDLYEGGVFEAKSIVSGNGYQKVTADGGTFRVLGDNATVEYLGALDESVVGRRGITFDTGNNTASIAAGFAADGRSSGAVRKTGSGTLILNTLPQTHGGIAVNEGTIRLASGATLGSAYSPINNEAADNIYPETPSATLLENNYLLHRWSFTGGNLEDSIVGSVATIYGGGNADGVLRENGMLVLPGGTKQVRYVDLGGGLFGTEDGPFTIEFWARTDKWSDSGTGKLLTVGNSGSQEIFINENGLLGVHTTSGTGLTDGWKSSKGTVGTLYHFSAVMEPPVKGKRNITFRYKDATTGETLGSGTYSENAYSPIIHQDHFYLGYSWHNENDATMAIDEVRIWNAALSEEQLAANAVLGANKLPTLAFVSDLGPLAVASGATFDLGGNEITYSKLSGSGTVANGTLAVADTLDLSGAMQINANISATGDVVFGPDSACVVSGTLDLTGSKIKLNGKVTGEGKVLAQTASASGSIIGTPQSIDMGDNGSYRLIITQSSVRIQKRGLVISLF